MEPSDFLGIVVGQDAAICVRNHEIDNIRELGGFGQEPLESKTTTLHAHHAHHTCSGSGLKAPDQCGPFFHHHLCDKLLFPVEVLMGPENQDRHKNEGRAQKDPGRYAKPFFLFDRVL